PVRRETALLYRPPAGTLRLRQRALRSRLPSRCIALLGPARATEAVRLRLHTGAARAVAGHPQTAGRALAALRSRRCDPICASLLALSDRAGRRPGCRRRAASDRRAHRAARTGGRASADERWAPRGVSVGRPRFQPGARRTRGGAAERPL